jgi:hypothetical protein
MVSKVDQLSTVEVSKKKSQLLQLVDSRFFVDFAVDFSSDFSGKMKEFVQNELKSSKISVEVNSRLRGRSEILQQFTFYEKVDQLSTYLKKSNNCRQLVNFQKKIPQQSIYRQKSTVDFKAWNGQCRRIVKLLKALLVIVVSDKMPVQAFEPTI